MLYGAAFETNSDQMNSRKPVISLLFSTEIGGLDVLD